MRLKAIIYEKRLKQMNGLSAVYCKYLSLFCLKHIVQNAVVDVQIDM